MKPEKEAARIPEHTATDTMVRAMAEFGDNVDRVVIVTLHKDGNTADLYSNARSEPEMFGMLDMAFKRSENILEDEDDD